MKIHLLGIAGSAMGNLALMLRQLGHQISGSDMAVYPPMSEFLSKNKIKYFTNFNPKNLKNPDLVIVGNAISRGNPELEEVLNKRIDYISLPAALYKFFLYNKTVICIAGSHGKSTTTALFAHMLEECGYEPSYFLGGVGVEGKASFKIGKGELFVIEGDEYDSAYFDKGPKFFHYRPWYLILTSLEFDHADIYDNIEQIQLAFARLTNMIPQKGIIIACHDYPKLNEVINGYAGYKIRCEVLRYGSRSKLFKLKHQKDNKKVSEINLQGNQQYILHEKNKIFFPELQFLNNEYNYIMPYVGRLNPKIFGEHNAQNMCAAVLLAKTLKIPKTKLIKSLESFPGISRRQTIVQEKPFIIIDDFAHHPTAVSATISAVKIRFPNKKIWALFEPRSATSHLNVFQKDWPSAFIKSDQVFIQELFNKNKFEPKRMLNVKKIVAECKIPAKYAKNADSLFNDVKLQIQSEIKNGKALPLILIMSNGGFGGIREKLVDFSKNVRY